MMARDGLSTRVPTTVAAALREGRRQLGDGELQLPPRRLCEALLASILKCGRLDFYTEPDRGINALEWVEFQSGLRRLTAGEPLQYVTGHTVFMERDFATDARALIPRPETEVLVRTWLDCRRLGGGGAQPTILDLGTGSGCIAVTLAIEQPDTIILGADLSMPALELARENARKHGVADRIEFIRGDSLAPIAPGGLDVIIANPPYIATADYLALPRYIRSFEPRLALDGGPAGLAAIDRLILQAGERLRPHGFLLLEIGDGQADTVRQRFVAAGFRDPHLALDIAGKERVVWGWRD